MKNSAPTAPGRSFKRSAAALALLGSAAFLLAPTSAFAQVNLGTAANFGVLGATPAVTNTGATVVTGKVGVSPAASITGFPPGVISGTGTFEAGTASAGQAQTDLGNAMAAAAGPACTNLTGQNLGGQTLVPGVYCFDTSAQITGDLTLDFQGNPSSSFLFRTGSTLTTASSSAVVATNTGGDTCLPNVNWLVGSAATLGTGSSLVGNILAVSSITLTTGARLRGRALAKNGAVTLDTNEVGGCAPLPPVAPPVAPPVVPPVPPVPPVEPPVVPPVVPPVTPPVVPPVEPPVTPPVVPPVVPEGSIAPVPTLQEWNLIILGVLLAGVGGWFVRRQGRRR